MEILELAKQLGMEIQNSPQMIAANKAEEVQATDETAQQLIKEYNLKRMQIAQKMQQENASKEEIAAARSELSLEFNKLLENENIKNYLEAKKEIDGLVKQVQNILAYYITGEDPGGCSSNCSSCSGCN